jgi:AraC-like DNA-binding protein
MGRQQGVVDRREEVSAWRPTVPGIAEVFHAHFVGHAYPMHTHDTWTLLIVDDGAIRFDLGHSEWGAVGATVTLLPPNVPHDGRAATRDGFRKRVLYLDTSVLGEELTAAAVGAPSLPDPLLRQRIDLLHRSLDHPGEAFETESRLAFIRERLRVHLGAPATGPPAPRADHLAGELRDLLDAHISSGVTLRQAAATLHAHPAHLVRCFTRAFGLPPHAYLTGRRVALARTLLLSGQRPAEVAAAAGFYDQAHLTRHFTRHVGASPARYAARM